MKDAQIQKAYEAAKERYAEIGVNTDAVLEQIANVSLSLHCWQTDDVTGFENPDGQLSGGIQATGNYPGKARNIEEVRKDIEKVKTLLPGNHRLNIHAIYGDFGGQKVDRDQIEPKHFQSWIRLGQGQQHEARLQQHQLSRTRRAATRRCRTATRASATSGSSIRSAAAKSPTEMGKPARRPRPATTCGFTTDRRT